MYNFLIIITSKFKKHNAQSIELGMGFNKFEYISSKLKFFQKVFKSSLTRIYSNCTHKKKLYYLSIYTSKMVLWVTKFSPFSYYMNTHILLTHQFLYKNVKLFLLCENIFSFQFKKMHKKRCEIHKINCFDNCSRLCIFRNHKNNYFDIFSIKRI